jgi:hypothetical protein
LARRLRYYFWVHIERTPAHSDDPNTAELARIAAGQLYLLRRDAPTGARECMCGNSPLSEYAVAHDSSSRSYNNAMATVRRTSVDFRYELAITRVYEPGEEQILDEDDESAYSSSSCL